MPKMPNKGIYKMPAEWEPQKSTWIAWPHNKNDWPGKFSEIPLVFGEIITILSKVQSVNILVRNKLDQKIAIFFLKILGAKIKNIKLIICKTDRAWVRDFLPIFLKARSKNSIKEAFSITISPFIYASGNDKSGFIINFQFRFFFKSFTVIGLFDLGFPQIYF